MCLAYALHFQREKNPIRERKKVDLPIRIYYLFGLNRKPVTWYFLKTSDSVSVLLYNRKRLKIEPNPEEKANVEALFRKKRRFPYRRVVDSRFGRSILGLRRGVAGRRSRVLGSRSRVFGSRSWVPGSRSRSRFFGDRGSQQGSNNEYLAEGSRQSEMSECRTEEYHVGQC